jgi:Uma2 family endonuclease
MVAREQPLQPALRALTRDEYHRLGDLDFFRGERVELVHGTVMRMPPIGPMHASIVGRLNELLLPRLHGRATLRVQQPFVAWDESEPEPDLAVVPLERYTDTHPDRALLVIEVAESSLAYDRDTKAPLYAASGVPEYWIVDVATCGVEVHSAPAGGRYLHVSHLTKGETLGLAALPDVKVAIADFWP